MHPTSRADHATAPSSALPGRLRLLAISLLATLLTILLPGTGMAQGATVSLPLGTPAPDVALEDLDGNPVQLSDYLDGKPALIEFWASWCENCEALQPQLDRIASQYEDQVNVIAVAVAVSQSQRRVKRHLEDHDPGYPYLWDGKGAVVRAYNAATTSIVMILDGEGRVAYSGVGAGQDLVSEVQRVLEGT